MLQVMTTSQAQLNTELFGALQIISGDETLMRKAVKALKRIASKKQSMDETEYIMSSPAMVEILRQGDEDIKNGKGRVVKLDDFMEIIRTHNLK